MQPCSQEPTTDPYPEQDESNPQHPTLRPQHRLHYVPIYAKWSKVKLSLCFSWASRYEGVLEEWRYGSMHP